MLFRIFICTVLLFCFPPSSFAENNEWSYVWVSSGQNNYVTAHGKAIVTIKQGKLYAELYDNNETISYKLVGNIFGKKVKAKFTTLDSDFFINSPFSGSYLKKRWSGFADTGGRDSISLTDGWNFIGLSHEVSTNNAVKRDALEARSLP